MALEDKDILDEGSATGGKPPASFGIESPAGRDEFSEVEKLKRETDIVKTLWEGLNNEFQKINKAFQNQKKVVTVLEKKVDSLEDRSRATELRSIEVIGIISAIIALVLSFVDTANAQRDLKDSFSILLVGTASLILFAVLLHNFFNKEDKRNWIYYLFAIGLPVIIIFAIGYLVFFK